MKSESITLLDVIIDHCFTKVNIHFFTKHSLLYHLR